MRYLLERGIARQVPVTVVDALEPVDIDHQAGDRSAAPLCTGQLLLQPLLQVAPVVPAREEIGDARAHQAGAIDRVLDAYRGDGSEVRQKIRAVMPRESGRITAAETQCAGDAVLSRQRQKGDALEVLGPGKQQVMIRPDEGAEPRFVQNRQLRRQADQRIDEENLLELLRPVAARQQ